LNFDLENQTEGSAQDLCSSRTHFTCNFSLHINT